MSNLCEAWTNHKKLTDGKAIAFMEYVVKNQKFLIPIGDFVFDSISLSSKLMLSRCLECERYQKHDCCTGNSYSMPEDNMKRLEPHIADILKCIPSEQNNVDKRLESFYKYGAITKSGATTRRGHEDGRCIFSIREGEWTKCAIHRWCLENNLNPMAYKPYTCSTFPVEGIVMPNGKIFVFCPTKDTQAFSMHHYSYTQKVCINEENLLKVLSGDVGNSKYLRSVNAENLKKDDVLKDYRPAYIESESSLRYLCGDNVYEELVEKMK